MIVSFLATKAAKKEVLVQKLVAVGIKKEGQGLFLKRKKTSRNRSAEEWA